MSTWSLKLNNDFTDLGQFVAFDQEKQTVDFILDHIVLFLPLEILLSVKGTVKYLQEKWLKVYRKKKDRNCHIHMRFCPECEDLCHHNKQLLSFWGWLFQPARSEEKTRKRTSYQRALKHL